ncbi:MAG: hypothetical protein P1U42_10985 [Phycisphaerales bacterium]|nr:hypothetical protein [Phycisphaerales bacterium]
MNEILNWIFGLGTANEADNGESSLGFGSPDAHLSFVHPLPAWMIFIAVVVLIAGVWWSYRAVPGSKAMRFVLGSLRVAGVAVLLAVALGPMIEQTNIRVEQDWALVMLDRSESLSTQDSQSDGEMISRDEQMTRMIDRTQQDPSWQSLVEQKQVLWIGFDDQVTVLARGGVPESENLVRADGRATNIGESILSALDEARARPISSIVLVSDGRSVEPIDPEIIHALQGSQIPVFVVPLGSESPVRDIAVSRVEAPSAVFADDFVPIKIQLAGTGITKEDLERHPMRIDLVEHSTGKVVGSHPVGIEHLGIESIDPESDRSNFNEWITITHTPTAQGDQEFDVVLVGDDSDALDQQLNLNSTNDQSSVRLRVVDRAMRVLYVDGYPRWEHRYIKNLLLREQSIVSSSLLLASSRRYVQEGDEVVTVLPNSLEEWEPYDVVILGDVRAELFSESQLESLREHVTVHGAGLLWIAGQSSTPASWYDSALSSLLPMHGDAAGSQRAAPAWESPVTMRSTLEADRLGVLGLNDQRDGWLDRLSNSSTGWSKLQWALALDETSFKPGVSVLANATSTIDGTQAPILTMMRYGAGRTIFVGTDEIWRWRYGRGEDLPERFWLPLIRTIGRGTVDRRVAAAALSITPSDPSPGNPSQVSLRIFDQQRIDSIPDELFVEVRSNIEQDEPELVLLRGTGDTRLGTWVPAQPGQYTASLVGVDAELSMINNQARVLDPSDEQRNLDTDYALLEMLATQSNGKMISVDDFGTIPELMPNRTRTIASAPKQSSLWDRPIILILLVILFTSEWIGRRSLRLA